ncbi:unnamed protein product [Rotaria magnacalcarata]|uniref:Uncharacterized protein n=1 Tax=Rotaria magnacalcarata TaxID=392030 RepID=A0A816AAA2_9BILA|nr:unnamed protein product [Rotaria magnacalcarata]
MYAARWFERLFQSCQRKSNNESSKDEHLSEDQHRLLNYDQLPNFGNDVLYDYSWSLCIVKNIHQLDWSWIQACEHEVAGTREQAAYEYKLLLNEHFKILQLTQDLTRIHNVDEHTSWSEERAAVSQVAALYQSASTTINSNWTALRMDATRITRQQNNFT